MHKLRPLLAPLRVFDAVNRAGGVTRAAKALHITPGAVSQQLKQLESALHVALFQKEGRDIKLTGVGCQLARRIADSFDRVENALSEAMESTDNKRLRLRVMPTFAIKWLVPRLTGFYARHGDMAIDIGTINREEDTNLDQADFVVRNGEGEWVDVCFDHLFDDEFVPVCSPKTAENITNKNDLLKMTLLNSMLRKDSWAIWLRSAGLSEAKTERNVMLANSALCYEAAAEGLGVAMAQKAYVADDLKRDRLVIPVDHVATTGLAYYLVSDLHKAETTNLKVFRDWIRSA